MDLLSGDYKIIKKTIEHLDDRLKGKYLSLLTARLSDIQSSKRIAAIQAISKFETPQAREVLVNLIKDKDHDVQYNATVGLFELNDPSTVEPLIENLNDESIKGITIRTLGSIGDSKATEPLMKELESCTNEGIKQEIIVALGRFGMNPSHWTKYVRVTDRITLTPYWEKGACHETKEIQQRVQTPSSRRTVKRHQFFSPALPQI